MAETAATVICGCLQPVWSSAYGGAEVELRAMCGFKKEVEDLKSRFSDHIEEAISKAEDVHLQAILEALLDHQRKDPNEKLVRKWFHKLKEVYYEVDVVVDKWNTVNLISEICDQNKVCCLIPCFYCQQLSLQREIAFHIKGLNEKLLTFDVHASQRQPNLELMRKAIEDLKPETSSWRLSQVYGRDKEREILMSKLLHGSCTHQDGMWLGKTIIIPIVGMGGVGKTALAQLVFSDKKVKSHFQQNLCWVSVPYAFDLTKIAKSIIEAVQRRAATNFVELNTLLEDTVRSIRRKKLLLVLDDVWTVEESAWNQLIATLEHSHEASRILVTTQKYDVVQMMRAGNDSMIHLELLSENDCWSILSPVASKADEEMLNGQLGDVRSKLSCKCNGLPLVAHTLENYLHVENTKRDWERVLQSDDLAHVKKSVFTPFLLNYYDLCSLHKNCFSYCSVFPRNYEIEKDDMVELWMSQGFLKVNENPEEEGQNCFKILARRYLFQDSTRDYNGDIITCKMHGIVHEFARFLTAHEGVMVEIEGADEQRRSPKKLEAHHLTLSLKTSDARIPTSMNNKKNLRTLFVVRSETSTTPLSCEFLVKLTCLRTLNLCYCNIERLPEEINNLVHLRYLNLSGNDSLRQLPNALCCLFNLQTLRLKGCTQLQSLPKEMGYLISLRHLYVEGCFSLGALPKDIQRLTSLRKLDMFVVPSPNYGKALRLEDLNTLQRLQEGRRIHIFRCGNIVDNQNRGMHLRFLDLKLNFIESRENGDDNTVLEALKPRLDLASLEIRGVRGTSSVYPTWMDLLTCLRRVVLGGWRNSTSLPPLGKLASLELLQIDDMEIVEEVGLEFLGITSNEKNAESFPKLKQLHFKGLPSWKKWQCLGSSGEEVDISIIIMPCLASLQISQCGSLQVLPSFLRRITQLEKLSIDQCDNLKPRCQEGAGEEWDKISRIPNIKINGETIRPRSLVAAQASTSGSAVVPNNIWCESSQISL